MVIPATLTILRYELLFAALVMSDDSKLFLVFRLYFYKNIHEQHDLSGKCTYFPSFRNHSCGILKEKVKLMC